MVGTEVVVAATEVAVGEVVGMVEAAMVETVVAVVDMGVVAMEVGNYLYKQDNMAFLMVKFGLVGAHLYLGGGGGYGGGGY